MTASTLQDSTDLIEFKKCGIIVPQISYEEFDRLTACNGLLNEKYKRFHINNNIKSNSEKSMLLWDKNVVFFPRKINGKFTFLHRIKPDIQIVAVNALEELNEEFWKDYFVHFNEHIVMGSKYEHEIGYIGGGCPPIETDEGWLLIYHGVHDTAAGYVYSACAALLDLQDPTSEIARLPYALFKPELAWERTGYVSNVVFPTGTTVFEDRLYIYYGAADKRVGAASVILKDLVAELLQHKI